MPVDPRKRQKKLERQKAKEKAQRRELARRESRGLAPRLEEAAAAPILHCVATEEIWTVGIGNVLISRQMSSGIVAFATFLVDVYCLGVKDVFMNVAPRPRYDREMYGKLKERGSLVPMTPECARKLIEGAVEYALGFGLPPHPDYRTAKLIFGDIAAEVCAEEYVYGQHGKPFFAAGPYDSPDKCQQILRALEKHCGPGGYDFMIPVGRPPMLP